MTKFIKNILNKILNWLEQKTRKPQVVSAPRPRIHTGVTVLDLDNETNVLDVDLIDDNISDEDKKTVRQYTKSLVTALSIMACIWISMSYLLSTVALVMYGNAEPLSSLSEKVCEVIIGVVIAYACKSFFESFAAAKHDLNVMKLTHDESINESIEETINDEESVG